MSLFWRKPELISEWSHLLKDAAFLLVAGILFVTPDGVDSKLAIGLQV